MLKSELEQKVKRLEQLCNNLTLLKDAYKEKCELLQLMYDKQKEQNNDLRYLLAAKTVNNN